MPRSSEHLRVTIQRIPTRSALFAILVDQQGLESEEILYHARFVEDLGTD
jgi:hypothetical protein